MTNEEIARFFNTTRPFIQGNPNLRDPQVEGWFRAGQHFRNSAEHAILQIPVGCCKTGRRSIRLPKASANNGTRNMKLMSTSWLPLRPGALSYRNDHLPPACSSGIRLTVKPSRAKTA